MGNNRQQLKEKIRAELLKKIEGTKKSLTSLDGGLKDVQKNSATAQGQVQASFDYLYQFMVSRKQKLMAQIEELSLIQTGIIQESIQKAYLELGNLQSTLLHIDSFDQSQLDNVQVSNDLGPIGVPPPIKTMIDTSALKDEISKWGSVYVNFANTQPQTGGSSTSSGNVSESAVAKISTEPKTPPTNVSPLKFDVDYWLQQLSQTGNDNEDFEMVFLESESSDDTGVKINLSPVEESPKPSNCGTSCITTEADDDGSSIVCMDSEELSEDLSKWLKPKQTKEVCMSDLSKWLKPRNTNNLPSSSTALVPPEVIHAKFNSGSTIFSKCQFLDYPCLRMDPKCWLHKKVSKENINYNVRTDIGLNSNEKQIPFPPSFSLPDTFWLKK